MVRPLELGRRILPATPEFRSQLQQLLSVQAGALLLDLRAFEMLHNYLTFVSLLHRDCLREERPLALCVQSDVAEVFAISRMDTIIIVHTEFEDAVAALGHVAPR